VLLAATMLVDTQIIALLKTALKCFALHMYINLFYLPNDKFCLFVFALECTDLVESLFHQAGFQTLDIDYAYRRTVNKKEGIDVPRIFVQAKFAKPD